MKGRKIVADDVTSCLKAVPPDLSRFLCGPQVRLNSSLIEWLFTDQCEIPALLRGVTGKKGPALAFVWLPG